MTPRTSEILDLYSDYLIASFGQTTATGMASDNHRNEKHPYLSSFPLQPPVLSLCPRGGFVRLTA